jgi:hypothetical protein
MPARNWTRMSLKTMEIVMKKYLLLAFLLMPVCAKSMDALSFVPGYDITMNAWSAMTGAASYVYQGGASLLNMFAPLGWDDAVETVPAVNTEITVSPEKPKVDLTRWSEEEPSLVQEHAVALGLLANTMAARTNGGGTDNDKIGFLNSIFKNELPKHLVDSRHEKLAQVNRCTMDPNKKIKSFTSKREELKNRFDYSMTKVREGGLVTIGDNLSCRTEITYAYRHAYVNLYPSSSMEDKTEYYRMALNDEKQSITLSTQDSENITMNSNKFFGILKNYLIKEGILCPGLEYTPTIDTNSVLFKQSEEKCWHRESVCLYKEFPTVCDELMSEPEIEDICKKELTLIITMTIVRTVLNMDSSVI